MTNLIETIKTVDLKAAVKEHIANQDAQVITCDDLDLAYDCSGNTYNINAPVIIETKTLFASDETKTLVFLTFHNGGDPRGNYEKETYILQGESAYDTKVILYSGEGGFLTYDWNTGETEYRNDSDSESWTIDPETYKIRHTEGDQPAPYAIINAIIEYLYGADVRDFSVSND